jgi:hypothetical protein
LLGLHLQHYAKANPLDSAKLLGVVTCGRNLHGPFEVDYKGGSQVAHEVTRGCHDVHDIPISCLEEAAPGRAVKKRRRVELNERGLVLGVDTSHATKVWYRGLMRKYDGPFFLFEREDGRKSWQSRGKVADELELPFKAVEEVMVYGSHHQSGHVDGWKDLPKSRARWNALWRDEELIRRHLNPSGAKRWGHRSLWWGRMSRAEPNVPMMGGCVDSKLGLFKLCGLLGGCHTSAPCRTPHSCHAVPCRRHVSWTSSLGFYS